MDTNLWYFIGINLEKCINECIKWTTFTNSRYFNKKFVRCTSENIELDSKNKIIHKYTKNYKINRM